MFKIAMKTFLNLFQHARDTPDVLKHIAFELVMANKHVDLATLNHYNPRQSLSQKKTQLY